MKLIFFLIAFSLITIRFYLSWSGKDRERRGVSESNIVIKSNNLVEEIHYSGKFQLNDDESGFKTISPGGYFKFRLNDVKVKAESNLRGEIEYKIYDGKSDLTMENGGRLLVSRAVKEMIYWGYDADARMERVYEKGGIPALLSEVDSVKPDNIKFIYLTRLFAIDSLSPEQMAIVVKKIEGLGSDMDRAQFLKKLSRTQFKNPSINPVYFNIIRSMNSDMDKSNSIYYIIEQFSPGEEDITTILDISKILGSDMDRSNLYGKLIDSDLIRGPHIDSLLILISNMNSDMDKQNLFRKVLVINSISENQWITLINRVTSLGSDMDKSNLLIEIARVMPKTDATKAAYLKSAKTIGNDNDYGRVMRAEE